MGRFGVKLHKRDRKNGLVRRWISSFCMLMIVIGGCLFSNVPLAQARDRASNAAPYVNAKGAIVYDATTGQVMYGKQADTPMYPASTTKLMTAILLVTHLNPDDPVFISTRAAHQAKVRLGITPGTTLTADEALRALLMKSANDVAYAVAETVGGSEEGFARMMNLKAGLIGCRHTRFVTP